MARLPLYLLLIPSFVNCLTCCVAFTEPPKKSCIEKLMKLSFSAFNSHLLQQKLYGLCVVYIGRAGVNAIVNGQVEHCNL